MDRRVLFTASILCIVLAGCLPATRVERRTVSSAQGREALRRSIQSASLPSTRRELLTEAESWLGTPYQYGGYSRTGTDCSGFVCNVFSTVHYSLPRNSTAQAQTGVEVDLEDTQPGDLVFFNTSGSGVSHVGILINSDQFIHASTSSGVIVSSLGEPYYRDRLMFSRRVIP